VAGYGWNRHLRADHCLRTDVAIREDARTLGVSSV
jgi:hypothetical protein